MSRSSGATRVVARGQRVHLRRPEWPDRGAFLAATRASRQLHRPWVHPPTTETAYRRWLDQLSTGFCERVLVWHNLTGELVGYVGLNEILYGNFRSASIAYWKNARFDEPGCMVEALSLTIKHAFSRMRLHRLEANVQPHNVRSLRLIRKLGFRKEGYSPRYVKLDGEWLDHERWAMTSEEWDEARATRTGQLRFLRAL